MSLANATALAQSAKRKGGSPIGNVEPESRFYEPVDDCQVAADGALSPRYSRWNNRRHRCTFQWRGGFRGGGEWLARVAKFRGFSSEHNATKNVRSASVNIRLRGETRRSGSDAAFGLKLKRLSHRRVSVS